MDNLHLSVTSQHDKFLLTCSSTAFLIYRIYNLDSAIFYLDSELEPRVESLMSDESADLRSQGWVRFLFFSIVYSVQYCSAAIIVIECMISIAVGRVHCEIFVAARLRNRAQRPSSLHAPWRFATSQIHRLLSQLDACEIHSPM